MADEDKPKQTGRTQLRLPANCDLVESTAPVAIIGAGHLRCCPPTPRSHRSKAGLDQHGERHLAREHRMVRQ